jgi:hypothetical protein
MDIASQVGTQIAGSFDWSSLAMYFALALLIAGIVGGLLYVFVFRNQTTPAVSKEGFQGEGFQGPVNGVSSIPCGQESAEAQQIVRMFDGRKSSTGSGEDDLVELKQILSKLLCLKADLMSTAQVVDKTTYLPYNNSHDRLGPADVAARCFTRSIPPRDLEISFDTWSKRASVLISKVCTSYGLSNPESEQLMNLFKAVHMDSFSVAQGACTPPLKAPEYGSPRDPKPFADPEEAGQGGPYGGYY